MRNAYDVTHDLESLIAQQTDALSTLLIELMYADEKHPLLPVLTKHLAYTVNTVAGHVSHEVRVAEQRATYEYAKAATAAKVSEERQDYEAFLAWKRMRGQA